MGLCGDLIVYVELQNESSQRVDNARPYLNEYESTSYQLAIFNPAPHHVVFLVKVCWVVMDTVQG
jgi:hypothetical protein